MRKDKYVLLEQYFGSNTKSVSKYVYLIKGDEFQKGALVIGDNYVGKIIQEVRKVDSRVSYKYTNRCYDIDKAKRALEERYMDDQRRIYDKPGFYYIPNLGYDYIGEEELSDLYYEQEDILMDEASEYATEILNKLLK